MNEKRKELPEMKLCRCGCKADLLPAEGLHHGIIGCSVCGEHVSAPHYESNEFLINLWNESQSAPKDKNEKGNYIY